MTDQAIVIAGTRPNGSCPPDGSHRWATRSFSDGQWLYTEYDGWLIASETTTNNIDIALSVEAAIRARTEGDEG